MIKSEIGNEKFVVTFDQGMSTGTINDQTFSWDLLPESAHSFHILKDNKSYSVIIESREGNVLTLRINGKKTVVTTKDKMALLLESMGLENTASVKLNEVKAPMPGLVLRILVKEGDEVQKGDSLLVLEAMKMENVIKSPGNGQVGKIRGIIGQPVEKNQVLISFV